MHITQEKMLSSGQVPRTLPLSLYIPRLWQHNITEAKFIVPDGGIKLTPAQGCRSGPPGYIGWQWQAGIRQPFAGVNFIAPSQGL
jgi:hypothetical protein